MFDRAMDRLSSRARANWSTWSLAARLGRIIELHLELVVSEATWRL
ncbi:MAG: hypothetical protein IPG61_17530 [bacterium]|nr:hypothetical protein [bacterium]